MALISRCLLKEALCPKDLCNVRSRLHNCKRNCIWIRTRLNVVRNIYFYHRHRAYVLQSLSPVCLLSYVLPHARLIPFISHLDAYIFARRTRCTTPTSGQRIIAEWAVTSEPRCATARCGIFSCKFNALHVVRVRGGYVKRCMWSLREIPRHQTREIFIIKTDKNI